MVAAWRLSASSNGLQGAEGQMVHSSTATRSWPPRVVRIRPEFRGKRKWRNSGCQQHRGFVGCSRCRSSSITFDQLLAAVHTECAPLPSFLRVFILGALLDRQVLVDDPTAGWATADRGIRSPVVVVFASLSWSHILIPRRSGAWDLQQLALQDLMNGTRSSKATTWTIQPMTQTPTARNVLR